MKDIESAVYDPIAKAVRAEFPGVDVASEYVRMPSKFPHVSITMSDNYTTLRRLDTASRERFSTVMFEVNVYSNKVGTKKSEAKAIMNFVDDLMYKQNFIRLALTPVPNMEDSSIYRITARYRAETDGLNLYRFQ